MNIKELPDLMTFVAVADANSFTGAAQELGVTHSVVSKRIQRLEATLGARLLHRTTRKITLTETGLALYERCSQIKKDIEEATSAVTAISQKPLGTLRVNAPMSFGQLHLVSAAADFMKLYPDVNIECILGRQYANLLEEGLDISIQIADLPDSSFVAKRIANSNTIVCASPEYLRKNEVPRYPHDLKNHNCLLYQQRKLEHRWHFIENKLDINVRVEGDFKVNSSQALVKAAEAHLGIARVANYLISNQIANGTLIPILKEFSPKHVGVHAVYPHQRHLAAKVKVFIEFLTERFQDEGFWPQI
jgi:DNA-binding transcriptional LysR family regulator